MELAAGGSQMPAITITTHYSAGLAFDANGNLWVASGAGTAPALIKFTPSQLAASGSPTPTTVVTSPQIGSAAGIAFDRAGNLWVADFQNGTVESFSPTALSAGGSQTPGVVITVPVPSLSVPTGPTYVAFDVAGNLWVATMYNTVLEYQTTQLSSSGAPTPAITLTLPTPSSTTSTTPNGLAFDNSYNLWVASYGLPTTLMEFTPAQIHTGGSQSPVVTLTQTGVVNYSIGLAFSPHSALLPLH